MKRILSLDGGGIRGVFSLQVLAAIEALFRRARNNNELVLADVFDLFAGTSTGAIIATCLSWGMPVKEIEALYLTCGTEIFAKEHWYKRWKTKYRAEPIAQMFGRILIDPPDSTEPAMGDPGGGSDFAGFYNHLGIPIAEWGFGGAGGV